MRYFAGIGDVDRELHVEESGVYLDGEYLEADISSLPGSDRHHLRMDGRSVALFARRRPDGWLIELEGRAFTVLVEDERSRHIRELASATRSVEGARELRAPMPGLIVRVEVESGEEVEEGDGLVIMEAMKMENELRAVACGRVVSIHVRAGDKVDRGQVLLRFA